MPSPSRAPLPPPEAVQITIDPAQYERRGRWWLIVSFLACPCHLPLSLGILAGVLGGTALGAALRDHALLAGLIIAAAWLAGTARGLLLIRRGERGQLACAVPAQRAAGEGRGPRPT